jgi:hypothetical protein
MHRGREARLDRLIRRSGEGDRAAVERYHVLSARAAIREGLARSGIDPAQVPALVVADEAAAELAASGDPPPPPSPEPPTWVGDLATNPLSRLDDRIGRLAARYRGGGQTPDLAQASLAELLAWCIAAADRSGST